MYHVGETVTPPTDRERPRGPCRFPPAELSNDRLRAIPEKIRSFRNAPQPAWQGLLTAAPGSAAPPTGRPPAPCRSCQRPPARTIPGAGLALPVPLLFARGQGGGR